MMKAVNFKGCRTVLFIALSFSYLSACGGSSNGSSDKNEKSAISTQPATIKIHASSSHFNQEEFDRFIAEPVKKKYPHITVERIDTSLKGNGLNELITAGTVPDIVVFWPGDLGNLNELALVYNIEELVKKHKFDTNRIEPEILQTMKVGADKNYLVGLPAYNLPFGLFYNKEVFDRMGVPYPKDNMTWEEIRELAIKLTKKSDGIQYRGLSPDNVYRGGRQISLPYADFNTNKSLLNTDKWHEMFQFWYSLYNIPGMTDGPLNMGALINGEVAMVASHALNFRELLKAPDVKWDLVTYPVNTKAPGVAQRVDTPVLSVTAQSQNKDAAFQVIETILSEEVQTEIVKGGRMTVLTDQKVKDQFGKGIPEFAGKNLSAMTKPKLAVIANLKYLNEGAVQTIVNKAFDSVVKKEKDINTALREADEQINKHIETQLMNRK